MLENKIDELIAAIDRNTAALSGKAVAATTTTTEKAAPAAKSKTEKAAPKSKHNRDEVLALAQQFVQSGDGRGPQAKEMILQVGGSAKIADVAESKLDALFEAFANAISAGTTEEEEEEL